MIRRMKYTVVYCIAYQAWWLVRSINLNSHFPHLEEKVVPWPESCLVSDECNDNHHDGDDDDYDKYHE